MRHENATGESTAIKVSSSLRRIRQEYKRQIAVDSAIPRGGTPGVVVRELERARVVPRDRLEHCREGYLLRHWSLEAATILPFLAAPITLALPASPSLSIPLSEGEAG